MIHVEVDKYAKSLGLCAKQCGDVDAPSNEKSGTATEIEKMKKASESKDGGYVVLDDNLIERNARIDTYWLCRP